MNRRLSQQLKCFKPSQKMTAGWLDNDYQQKQRSVQAMQPALNCSDHLIWVALQEGLGASELGHADGVMEQAASEVGEAHLAVDVCQSPRASQVQLELDDHPASFLAVLRSLLCKITAQGSTDTLQHSEMLAMRGVILP